MAKKSPSSSRAAQAVDRQLAKYRSMRDFSVTAEPRGGQATKAKPGKSGMPFVVQKHAATRLHYDFRLGWRGVLKSWAVTKGPSYYPGDKRLAVQVEDHPMDYGGFEGTIPKGEYGGGTVMVWDFGEWSSDEDIDRGLEEGHLKFELHGTKLKGRWALVRMHTEKYGSGKPNWLLIKDRDEFARGPEDKCITDEAPNSALTRRSLEQIAGSEDHVWDSRTGLRSNNRGKPKSDPRHVGKRAAAVYPPKPAAQRVVPSRRAGKQSSALSRTLDAAPRESFPGFIPPQLPQRTTTPPSGDNWVHELKLDGYRVQIHLTPGKGRSSRQPEVRLWTRNGLDWTARMPAIAEAAAGLDASTAIIDGEMVVLDEQGTTSFAALQESLLEKNYQKQTYFAFDLLHLNGRNPRGLPLTQRKALLKDLLGRSRQTGLLRMSEHVEAAGKDVFAKACELGAEGIVSKLADSKYASGRGATWLKAKCYQEQELVIGGFTVPSDGSRGVGALLLGYYDRGKLVYAGRSGTGFTQKIRRDLRKRLDAIARKEPPFAEPPREARKGAQWVEPKLVAQISFTTWTRDNLVRQAAFRGLREDKPAQDVEREAAMSVEKAEHAAESATKPALSAAEKGSALRTRSGAPSTPSNSLAITHPNKVLDFESGMTKLQLAEYYLAVADRMLPHIADRPLSVVRCPEGSSKPCFFQKHVGVGLPPGVKSVSVPSRKTGEHDEFLTLDSAEGLIGMAQMGVLEIHPWGSHNESLEKPDRIIFDFDPDTTIDWRTLADTASAMRTMLKRSGLTSYVKSTGGKGLHVVAPIQPEFEWPAIKAFAHALVLDLERRAPDLYLTKMTKAARKGRIYLDYLRNDREATAVAPFSPRARSGAPVAVTLEWKELDLANRPSFHVTDLADWKARLRKDPWRGMEQSNQKLTRSMLEAAGVRL